MARRWPSNTVVSQLRLLLSVSAAQILAASAASCRGPAASLSCMPSPVLLSRNTMIGCNSASAALLLWVLSRPRHSARKPPIELAPPSSTANSVRWIVEFSASLPASASSSGFSSSFGDAAAAFASSAGVGGAVTGTGAGAALAVFAVSLVVSLVVSLDASIIRGAPGSGGPIMDFVAPMDGGEVCAATTGAGAGRFVAAVAVVGLLEAICGSDAVSAPAVAGFAASVFGWSALACSVFACSLAGSVLLCSLGVSGAT